MRTNDLDDLLTQSDPARDLTASARRQVAELADRSEPARKIRHLRPVAISGIAAMVLAGGGVAAAAATIMWSPWAQDEALGALHYTLPSGQECEYRLGNVQGAPDEVDTVVREVLDTAEIDDEAVYAGAERIGLPADPRTDDDAYQSGYMWVVHERITGALAAHNLSDDYTSIDGEAFC